MSDIFNLFSYLIMLLLFAAGIFYLLAKIKVNKLGYWLLAGYTFVILCSIIVYTLLPVENLPAESELTGEDARADIMHKVAYRGLPIEDFEQYKIEEWEFEIPENERVNLSVDSSEFYFPVMIEKVNDATNISAALYYAEPGFDFGSKLNSTTSVGIRSENGELIITPPGTQYFHYAQFSKEFPLTQLSGNRDKEHIGSSFYTGEYVLYLKIPANQDLIIDDPNVTYEYIY